MIIIKIVILYFIQITLVIPLNGYPASVFKDVSHMFISHQVK